MVMGFGSDEALDVFDRAKSGLVPIMARKE